MGSMDRNTVIGFILLAALLFLYLFLSTKSSQDLQKQKMAEADSIAHVKRAQDSLRIVNDTTGVAGRFKLFQVIVIKFPTVAVPFIDNRFTIIYAARQ